MRALKVKIKIVHTCINIRCIKTLLLSCRYRHENINICEKKIYPRAERGQNFHERGGGVKPPPPAHAGEFWEEIIRWRGGGVLQGSFPPVAEKWDRGGKNIVIPISTLGPRKKLAGLELR